MKAVIPWISFSLSDHNYSICLVVLDDLGYIIGDSDVPSSEIPRGDVYLALKLYKAPWNKGKFEKLSKTLRAHVEETVDAYYLFLGYLGHVERQVRQPFVVLS